MIPRATSPFSRFSLFSGAVFIAVLTGCKAPPTASSGNASPATTTGATTGAQNASTGDKIVIGHYGSLTGGTATFGTSTDNGIKMAFGELNAKGGVLGKQLDLITEDDGSKTEQVPTVVQKLITQDNVLALLGEVASSRSKAAAPIAQGAGVPMVSPASTNPEVTKIGNYIFRTCFIDPFQGKVMATFAKDTLKAKNAAVFTDAANDYSKGLSQVFIDNWEKSGGKIVSHESYSEGDTDFQSQLTKIKGKTPDVIFIPGYYTEVANIAVQSKRLGIKAPLMGTDGWDSPELFKIAKGALEGCYYSNHYSPQSKDARVVKFVGDYKTKFGDTPDAMAALGYDAALILADSIKRAGSTDRAKVRDALATTKDFAGVTGNISIDKDRNAVKSAVVLKIKGNEGVYVSTVKP